MYICFCLKIKNTKNHGVPEYINSDIAHVGMASYIFSLSLKIDLNLKRHTTRRQTNTMDAWAYIMDLVGEPGGRWPKYCGHLNYRDRVQLVVLFFANGVSPELIKELAGYTQVCLRDASAEKHWASLAQACANDKAFRAKYYARDLISSDVVHLDGRVKYSSTTRRRVPS